MKRLPESRVEMRSTIQRIVDGTAGTYELDDYFSGSFSNPKLEAIRRRLWSLPDEFPPLAKGEFCSAGGIEVMRGWIEELSDENA